MSSNPSARSATPSNQSRFSHFLERLTSPSKKHRAPPLILPPNSTMQDRVDAAGTATIALEVTNYPGDMTPPALHDLFAAYPVSPNIVMRAGARRFLGPLRAIVYIRGLHEAQRAVEEVNGKVCEGKQLKVKILDPRDWEEKEAIVKQIAGELQVHITNAARAYFPHLAPKLLEVRESFEGGMRYAFLQAREPVTAQGEQSVNTENEAKWELIAAGDSAGCGEEGVPRLVALKDLQARMEKQGRLGKIWTNWKGSWEMQYEEE